MKSSLRNACHTIHAYAVAQLGTLEDWRCIGDGQGGPASTRSGSIERFERSDGCAGLQNGVISAKNLESYIVSSFCRIHTIKNVNGFACYDYRGVTVNLLPMHSTMPVNILLFNTLTHYRDR